MKNTTVISHLRWLSLARRAVGLFSNARRAVVKVLYKLAPFINLEAPSTTLSGIAAVKLKNPRGHSPVKL
ncbi:hypothetical protein HMPREF9453_00166 [Dialister succinatiphilus YIT 11850]|uniref:Uncharacterized protein n=1 Tax=Dialister succinatiphilus YIT 11850 TaxID=742743 RepID=H1CXS8_9FIRM|nr:hypothetical protein HMPREF9453_00166 [Dialister succinatiphilus YIT 11850]